MFRVGNCHFVRLPKNELVSSGISDMVEIAYREGTVIIKPFRDPQEGWSALYEKSFANECWEDPLLPGESGDGEPPDYDD